jgi:NAD(P)-dependent dehydrogenase (short-subunit alcohol dehydrogenase family)
MNGIKTPFRLDNRVALITGGSSGIGEATARAFTRAGASVLILSIDKLAAEALAAELPGSSVIHCDVTDESAVAAAIGEIKRLDILVNSAGIGLVGNIEETSLGDLQRLFRVNVEGTFLVTKAALGLIKASHGSIINIGSVAGLIGVKRRFAYCATKGAVIAFTKQLAVDYPTEFRVNCICPGTIDTPFVEGFLERYHQHEKAKVREDLRQRQPIGRLGRPEEVADLAVYLASEESGFMNGAVLPIDGGWTAA